MYSTSLKFGTKKLGGENDNLLARKSRSFFLNGNFIRQKWRLDVGTIQANTRLLFIAFTRTGANPTIASHNASAVKINNATSSLERFVSKNIYFYFT
jgi:hypothetical protein